MTSYESLESRCQWLEAENDALAKAIRWLVARERDEYVESQADMILERERKLANKFTCPVEPVADLLLQVLEEK